MSEKTTDVESLKSVGTSGTDQVTRPTSPEEAATEVPGKIPSGAAATIVEVPPVVA